MSTTANNETLERIIKDLELRETHRISSIHYLIELIKTITKEVPSVGHPSLLAEINGELDCWVTLKDYLNGRGLYTREQVMAAIKDSLKEAADNAKVASMGQPAHDTAEVDKSSITNEKNIKL